MEMLGWNSSTCVSDLIVTAKVMIPCRFSKISVMVNGEDQQIIQSVGQTWPQTVFGNSLDSRAHPSTYGGGGFVLSGRADSWLRGHLAPSPKTVTVQSFRESGLTSEGCVFAVIQNKGRMK